MQSKLFELENEISEVQSKLKFISKIGPKEKIDVASLSIVSAESWSSSLYRTFSSESRKVTLDFLQAVVTNTFGIIIKLSHKDDSFSKNMKTILIQNIRECIPGIKNLIETYKSENDRMIVSQLETQICMIETKIIEIS